MKEKRQNLEANTSKAKSNRFLIAGCFGMSVVLILGVLLLRDSETTKNEPRPSLPTAKPIHPESVVKISDEKKRDEIILSARETKDFEKENLEIISDLETPKLLEGTLDHAGEREVGVKAMFGYSQLVSSLRTEPDERGRFLKVEIFNTDFKYPMIRIAERWDSSTQMTARSAMVADHILVRWMEAASPEEIAGFLTSQPVQIRDLDPDSNIALISFDGNDPRSLGKILNSFRSNPLVKSADPDYLATNNPDAFK